MKYHIITYGCQMNKSDSERLAAKLEKQKHQLVKNLDQADLVVINVCSVRQSAINRVYSKVRQLNSRKPRPKIILTGCLLAKDKKQLQDQIDEIWPMADFKLKPRCQSLKQAYLPIMTGCNNFCSYCVVPYTRGQEKSRPATKIIKEFKNLIKQGYQEIMLLGQNVNSYQGKGAALRKPKRLVIENDVPCGARASFSGRASGLKDRTLISFPNLLQTLNHLPGKFKISFMTSHPKDMSDELIKVISQGEKISKQVHLPVQSGDNQILKKMNRHYTIGHYKKLIKKIRLTMPQAEISTDIIVGFPGETKKQFQNTIKLIKQIGFKQIYAAAYSPRPNTAAAKLKDNIPSDEKKRRKRIVLDLMSTSFYPQNKLIIILGPTASGKSDLAVRLAKKFKGEIVSADSRQIYQEMNIATAKITKKEMAGIPHYLIDIIKPNQKFTLAQFKQKAVKIIKNIQKRNRLPFLVGGTMLYIQSIVDNLQIPEVKPDKKLRAQLENKTNQELYNQLKKIDLKALEVIDINNKRRMIRALEVCLKTKKPFSQQKKKGQSLFDILQIGPRPDQKILDKRIDQRVEKMIEAGLIKETENLIKKYGTKPYSMSGIGYKEALLDNAKELIKLHTRQYARRQISWFKRDKRIHWTTNYQQAEKLIRDFLS